MLVTVMVAKGQGMSVVSSSSSAPLHTNLVPQESEAQDFEGKGQSGEEGVEGGGRKGKR